MGVVEIGPVTNHPLYAPSDPSPVDGAEDVGLNVVLGWSGGDPDEDAVTYDVYLAVESSSVKDPICADVAGTSSDPGTLSARTLYRWWVVARDENDAVTTGPVWGFTTGD